MAFPNNGGDIVRYLVDVAVELRDHVGTTHAHKSKIKKELLDVMDLSRKLQVTCFDTTSLKCSVEQFSMKPVRCVESLHLQLVNG
jgi:hypothetical protein